MDYQNKIQNKVNIVIVVFVFLQLIFLILVGTGFSRIASESFLSPYIAFDDLVLNSVEKMPDDNISFINKLIYSAVSLNVDDIANIEDSGGVVRIDSVAQKYFERINMNYTTFILDIPAIRQSYRVFNEWSDDEMNAYIMRNNSTMVMCLDKSEMIYDDFNCQDAYGGMAKYSIMDSFGIAANFSENENLNNYEIDYGDGIDDTFVDINVMACGDEKIKEKAKSDVAGFFKELGYDLEAFNYRMVDGC